MALGTGFNKNWRKWFMNDVIKAVQTYAMIEDSDRICVALSGGKDSVTLLFILYLLTRYSHLTFTVSAMHIKTDDYQTTILQDYCADLEISYYETQLQKKEDLENGNPCYICSRLKRGALSAELTKRGIKKVAYGHHADDVAETLLMNICLNQTFGSFCPVVTVNGRAMTIIRPMIYLEEQEIKKIHSYFKLPLMDHACPYEKLTKRALYKKGVRELNSLLKIKGFSKKVVNSLENIDLTNIWPEMKKR